MGLEKERIEFVAKMVAEGMAEETAKLVMRDATTIQRLAAEACNRSLTNAEEAADGRAMTRIRERLPMGFGVDFNGDPRGACTKIKVPSGRTDDWGGTGICVPTRRF